MSSDTRYNMDEPTKHANWKTPETKKHILYGSMYMIYSE